MAKTVAKKNKPAAAAKRIPAATKPAPRESAGQSAPDTQPAEDPRRFLREAAWAQMFGRTASNPFGR